jgi:hypothetical protein
MRITLPVGSVIAAMHLMAPASFGVITRLDDEFGILSILHQ